jgi:Na+/H+-dicarboxylate symporter
MKKPILITLLISTTIFLAGCTNQNSIQPITNPTIKTDNYLTYLTSTKDPLQYCNGDEMNSDEYKKTITNKITTNIVIDKMTQNEIVKATILAATSGMCHTVMKETDIQIENETAYISPIE